MKVLPSFAVVPAMQAWPDLGGLIKPLMVHGEQSLRLHRPLTPNARVVLAGKVVNIYDKGKSALIELTISGAPGRRHPHVRYPVESILILEGGGFGGDPGPKTVIHQPPSRRRDFEIAYQVPLTQAALYRLLGDLNPLHIDPQAAALAGFPRPVLHGLCTYGYATRALVSGPLGGNPDGLREFSPASPGRFFPATGCAFQIWRQGDAYLLEAETPNGPVLKNGLARLA